MDQRAKAHAELEQKDPSKHVPGAAHGLVSVEIRSVGGKLVPHARVDSELVSQLRGTLDDIADVVGDKVQRVRTANDKPLKLEIIDSDEDKAAL
jgi:hypothetical protein